MTRSPKPVRRAPNADPDLTVARLLVPALKRVQNHPMSPELRASVVRFTGELATILDPHADPEAR